MEVVVAPHRAIDVMSRREIDTGQYRIEIDGKLAGFMGYHDGASPLLVERRSPVELEAIRNEVARQVAPQTVGPIKQVSQPPKPPPKPDTSDDFN